MMKSNSIGFFALWNNKDSEYHADDEEKSATLLEIEGAFNATIENGTKIFTQFETRWSTEREYFAFWEVPTFEILEKAMIHLEKAGDFKFAESEHIIGRKVNNEYSTNVPPEILAEQDWLGCLIAWNWTDAYYNASPEELISIKNQIEEIFNDGKEKGLKLLGIYDSRYSSQWDKFIFCLLPNNDLLEKLIDKCEQINLFKYIKSRHVIGKHNPIYRFAREMQY